MHELMILLSEAMPVEELVKKLKDAITEWEINPSAEHMKSITFYGMMLSSKELAAMSGGAKEMIKAVDHQKTASELFSNLGKNTIGK